MTLLQTDYNERELWIKSCARLVSHWHYENFLGFMTTKKTETEVEQVMVY